VPAGPVGDLGCGTGRITTYQAAGGLDAFGIDLTPRMIEVARQQYPEPRFEVGTLYDPDLKSPEKEPQGYLLVRKPPEHPHPHVHRGAA
jgi:trans-aconitate methyltransferase